MEWRTEFEGTKAEHDGAMEAGFELMDFIMGLALPIEKHNALVEKIDQYRAECEEGLLYHGCKRKTRHRRTGQWGTRGGLQL